MQAMVCELCGSNDIVKQDGVYVCQHCGTKYSVEEARKLIGVVQIDKSKDTENYLMLARRAKSENNSANAAKYYDMVLQNDPTNWEASFYQVYFQAMGCRIMEIQSAAKSVSHNILQTMTLINQNVEVSQQKAAFDEVIDSSIRIAILFSSAAKEHFEKFKTTNNAYEEYAYRLTGALNIYDALELSIKEYFKKLTDELLHVQKMHIKHLNDYGQGLNENYVKKEIKRIESDIRTLDSGYKAPKKGGCYVATCVYGSYDCPPVWTLRRFRDFSLAETWYGRVFIRLYYTVSPIFVKWFGNNLCFKRIWRHILDKMVIRLQNKGYVSTPYDD